jgi:tetratricopeptide (TPR) repeat protein
MRKSLVLVLFVALAALFVSTASAQMTTAVKGIIRDDAGKPMVGAEVWYTSVDSGRKVVLKTDKKGEYYSMGFSAGTYDVKLYMNGQLLFTANSVRVAIAKDNFTEIDLSKEKSRQAAGMSEADKKKIEEATKENAKIKGLNAKLAEAKAAQDAGNIDQAITILQEATQIDATKDILWARLADTYTAAKKYPEAEDAFKKAIAIAPTNAAYHNNLGQAYVKDRKTDEAIAAYNQAAQLDPANAGMYYFNLGAVLTNSGKLDEANTAFDKAIAADPAKADAYYWKGVNMLGKATIDKSGKMVAPEGTSDALNKYLELAPEGPYAQATKELLASLGASVQTSFGPDKKKKK